MLYINTTRKKAIGDFENMACLAETNKTRNIQPSPQEQILRKDSNDSEYTPQY
jgi:hypothetical protein